MSRVIKFKAWNKKTNQMGDVLEIRLGVYVIVSIQVKKGNVIHSIHYNWPFDEDEIELLQFTGRKDVNGIEIYNSDIVFRTGMESKIFEIKSCCQIIDEGNYSDGKFSSNVKFNYTVLGNRFEDPALLNATPETIGYWLKRRKKCQ